MATEAQRQKDLVSVLWMLIYISSVGERDALPFTEEREGNSREGQTESECK